MLTAAPPVITLLTDFGLSDPYVGMMKGMLLRLGFRGPVVDLSHGIPPQNVAAASFWLERSFSYFPSGTIHVAVVDPGVGTARRPLLLGAHSHFFVGPDNGLFDGVLRRAGASVTAWELHRERVQEGASSALSHSATFDGRDLFAPTAALLGLGQSPESLASPLHVGSLVRLPQSNERTIVAVDHFGNLITDCFWPSEDDPKLTHQGQPLRWVRTYGDGAPGELIALRSSAGTLELAVVSGSATKQTGLVAGDKLPVHQR